MLAEVGEFTSTYSPRADTYAVGCIVRYSVVPRKKEFYEVRGQACNTAPSQTISPGSAVAPVPRTEGGPRLLNIGNSLEPPLWNTWSLLGVEKHKRGKEQTRMSEQAQKVVNKNIPEWAQGLYYSSGMSAEVLVYYDDEAIYFEHKGKDSGIVRFTFEQLEGLKIVEEEEQSTDSPQ